MSAPTLISYQDKVQNTQGQAVPGATITVLSGQTDTVNVAAQPGSPLATIYADPYGNSKIPQVAVNLSGNVVTTLGSTAVALSSGNPLSQFLVGNTITINGVQYTVAGWTNANLIALATPALSTGTFAYSATIPVTPLVSDGLGNFQFWAAAGYYVLQIYGGQITAQSVQGISLSVAAGGGGLGPVQTGSGENDHIMLTTLKGAGQGPNNPTTVVGYSPVTIGATVYYVPLFQ